MEPIPGACVAISTEDEDLGDAPFRWGGGDHQVMPSARANGAGVAELCVAFPSSSWFSLFGSGRVVWTGVFRYSLSARAGGYLARSAPLRDFATEPVPLRGDGLLCPRLRLTLRKAPAP
jgi:hypothetical protein